MSNTPVLPFSPPTDEELKDGTSVTVGDSTEKWSEFELEDGAKVRIKTSIISAVRLNKFDESGSPIYVLNLNPSMVIIHNDDLKRKQ